MEQLNRIELRGNVGNSRIQNVGGNQVAHFTIATNYAYKDKNGAAVIETTWHNVVAWANEKFPDLTKIDKGAKLYVCGRMQAHKFQGQDGQEHFTYEVLASRIVLIEDDEPLSYAM